ncbi:DEAD/DEAH box helicase [Shewanella cyperi]|uniref:DEAD/DEAH box helicase n=1 Tax=Shewanella cyperi TaxID=2814292 RepID=UPI001A94BDAD|nr:DEAD/DEAH box helicase [Shewanella cyperi]QSX41772.1 DEAD/DEAH box helicase [Shewanella cyperi]
MSFEQLGLDQPLLHAVADVGYRQPTPIQQQVIPEALKGRDMLACARTGTGKTAAFLLPLLQRLNASSAQEQAQANAGPRALVLVPTRELAQQVALAAERYSQATALRTLAVYGGANIRPQARALASGIDLLVATPGRLFDLVNHFGLRLDAVSVLVVDEADRMLDLGFVRDIHKCRALIAAEHQTLCFSATFDARVQALGRELLRDPLWIQATATEAEGKLSQQVWQLDSRRRSEFLAELIGRNNWQQVLVFVASRQQAGQLCQELKLDGLKAEEFHGERTQGARNRALDAFKEGKLRVLVATDVAARGLHIEALPVVVNFGLPEADEDFTHRIGRSARAGQDGLALTLVTAKELPRLKLIAAKAGIALPDAAFPAGYEPGAPLPARYRELPPEGGAVAGGYREDKPRRRSDARGPGNSSSGNRGSGSSSQGNRGSGNRGSGNRNPDSRGDNLNRKAFGAPGKKSPGGKAGR